MLPQKLCSIYITLLFLCAVTSFNDREMKLFVFSRTSNVSVQTNSEIYSLIRNGVTAAINGNDRQLRYLIIQLFISSVRLTLQQIIVFNEVLHLIKNEKLTFNNRSEVRELSTQLAKLLTLEVKNPKDSQATIKNILREIKENFRAQDKESQANASEVTKEETKVEEEKRVEENEKEGEQKAEEGEKRKEQEEDGEEQEEEEEESLEETIVNPVVHEQGTSTTTFVESPVPPASQDEHKNNLRPPVSPSSPIEETSKHAQTQKNRVNKQHLSLETSRKNVESQRGGFHEPLIGCQSASDRAILYENADKNRSINKDKKPRNRFYELLLECSLSNFGAAEATIKCLKKKLASENKTLSDQCLDCFKESVKCGRSNCTFSCMFSSACGDTCFNCGVRYCQESLKKCAGLADLPPACS